VLHPEGHRTERQLEGLACRRSTGRAVIAVDDSHRHQRGRAITKPASPPVHRCRCEPAALGERAHAEPTLLLFSWAAISPRHLSSVVFVMPPIVAATPLQPRWVSRALTLRRSSALPGASFSASRNFLVTWVSPSERRAVAEHFEQDFEMSERRAAGLAQLSRSVLRYRCSSSFGVPGLVVTQATRAHQRACGLIVSARPSVVLVVVAGGSFFSGLLRIRAS
jgi:hypothetical protein